MQKRGQPLSLGAILAIVFITYMPQVTHSITLVRVINSNNLLNATIFNTTVFQSYAPGPCNGTLNAPFGSLVNSGVNVSAISSNSVNVNVDGVGNYVLGCTGPSLPAGVTFFAFTIVSGRVTLYINNAGINGQVVCSGSTSGLPALPFNRFTLSTGTGRNLALAIVTIFFGIPITLNANLVCP